MREVEYFQSKIGRDARVAELKRDGYPCRKRSCRNQVLSPTSVTDYSGHITPNGFGGAAAQWFTVLYVVEY